MPTAYEGTFAMCPKRRRSRSVCGGLLLALLVSGPAGAAQGPQDDAAQPRAVSVPIDGAVRIRMSTRKPILPVKDNPKETAIAVRTVVGDPSSILVLGERPGVTHLTLTDADGKSETYKVVVLADVEYLGAQLRRAVPTAHVIPISMSDRSVLLKGTVRRAEDATTLRDVTRGLGFRCTDRLRVSATGDEIYSLTVTVVEPRPDKKIVLPCRRVAEAQKAEFRHRFPDQSALRVNASVLEIRGGELDVALDVETRWGRQKADDPKGQYRDQMSTVCRIAPGAIIRVKLRKAGCPEATLTADIRVEKKGEKGRPRVHLLDFVSGKIGVSQEPEN